MPDPKTLPSIRRSGVRILPALACICLFATAARAASPSLSLHADLYSGPNAPSGGGVQEAVGFDGRHLFVTNSREEGAELWVSDGTAAGTRRLADICPGACSSDPRNFSVVGDRLYFDADDGIHGREPWMLRAGSDQPELLADMMPGIESSNPGVIRAVGMTSSFPAELRTLFVGKRPDVGRELFRIENDTVLLDTDLVPGPLDSGVDSPVYFGNRMLLTTIFAPGASGEVPVVLNYPASLDAPATPDALVGFPTGGAATSLTLYPVGNGNVVIRQFNDALWGALVGNSGGAQVFSGDVTQIIATDSGPVYFTDSVDKTLHVSDGTAAGTKAIGPAASEQLTGLPGGILAFIAPLTDSADREVWLSLGSAGLTGLYAEVVPGSAGLPAHARFEVPADGSFLYLIFNDDIWRIDDGGPQRIAIDPGFSSTFAFRAAEGPSLLFSGIGNEPFITDGLPNDVRQLADVRNDFGHSFMRPRGVINGRVIGDAVNSGAAFSAERTVSVSTASPVSVEQIETRALQEPARRLGSRLLVKGDVVLSTDGTSAGTERLQIAGKVSGGCAVVDGNQLFTVTSNNDFTMVLRQTDGTPAGTSALAEYAFSSLIAGCSPDNPPLAGMDGLLYLAGFTNTDGPLLSWDGATLSDVDVSPATSLQGGLVSLGDRLLFAASETAHGRELWRTDGTDGGAFMVKDIMPGTVGSLPAGERRLGNRMLFIATSPDGREPWSSDGTAAGTQQLRDIAPGAAWSTNAASGVFLDSNDTHALFRAAAPSGSPDFGCPLFITDGTPTGTRCAQNRDGPSPPAPMSSATAAAFTANGSIVFVSADADSGEEIRVLRDGVLVPVPGGDLRPGADSSGAGFGGTLVVDGDVVYFGANSGSGGFELFRLDVSALGPPGPLFVNGFED